MQVESFMLLLLQLTLPALAANKPLHVVEFGSGSGNLVLPLAHLFPSFSFTAVDMKASAVQLLRQRVQQGQMRNVRVQEGTIEAYKGELKAQQDKQNAGILVMLAGRHFQPTTGEAYLLALAATRIGQPRQGNDCRPQLLFDLL
jgi:SAM-dependent methyltransferase